MGEGGEWKGRVWTESGVVPCRYDVDLQIMGTVEEELFTVYSLHLLSAWDGTGVIQTGCGYDKVKFLTLASISYFRCIPLLLLDKDGVLYTSHLVFGLIQHVAWRILRQLDIFGRCVEQHPGAGRWRRRGGKSSSDDDCNYAFRMAGGKQGDGWSRNSRTFLRVPYRYPCWRSGAASCVVPIDEGEVSETFYDERTAREVVMPKSAGDMKLWCPPASAHHLPPPTC